jgi:hypothetical protein
MKIMLVPLLTLLIPLLKSILPIYRCRVDPATTARAVAHAG